MNGIESIAAERYRQVRDEGFTREHDDEHAAGEIAGAALCYIWSAMTGAHQMSPPRPPAWWPWAHRWWKPKGRREDLVRAGALIAAEIDRIDRRAARGGPE
ncbi:hypothetical protein [Albimonas pacifica]|uniref:Uncharacterized protein n=1 Tax=Albimonas pacifica TaxID=1114924 RepID=A0A1I3HKC2_9RHOB|nr:hypothetical protein [Albimonas pacifica]SFI36073.1 hypothetical protein SAMN05216258_10640 [Albimonas pacifica]